MDFKNMLESYVLSREEFSKSKIYINRILNHRLNVDDENKQIIGLIDNYEADIILEPLDSENACREVLLVMSNIKIEINDIIRYRPLGCPIIHFARIIEKQNLLITVHVIGPCARLDSDLQYIDVGVCMLIGFEGKFKGRNIHIGDTVRFLPSHCMMQKVHSGVVVNIESNKVSIEGIDLKVWNSPQKIK
jgi:uncharacterized Fe-S cluster-containing protein